MPQAATLDRSRSMGYIYTSGKPSKASFFQDGKHFDGQGKRVMLPGDAEREEADKKAREASRKDRAKALRKQAEALEAGKEPEPEEGNASDIQSNGVNLSAWGRGETKYRFAAVRQAIEDRYSRSLHNESDALLFLVEEGVITGAQLKARKSDGRRSRL